MKHKKKILSLADREQLIRDAQRYTLFDDTFMNAVFANEEACQYVLEVITQIPGIQVIESKPQYALKSVSTRSAILDILAKDANGQLYNVEFQKADTTDHARRVRFYSAMIDGAFTPKAASFNEVPNLISIYISQADIWHQGKPVYRVKKELDDTGLPYDDGHIIIFANAAVNDGSKISNLMNYFKTADPEDPNHGKLSRRVRYLKLEEGGHNEMCEIAKKYFDQGQDKVRFDIFHAMVIEDGLSITEALAKARVPEEDHERYTEMLRELSAE